MKYTTIRISRDGDGWTVSAYADRQDRVHSGQRPHPLGFYYCPRTTPVTEGFEALRNRMTAEMDRIVANVTKLKAKIMRLDPPADPWEEDR